MKFTGLCARCERSILAVVARVNRALTRAAARGPARRAFHAGNRYFIGVGAYRCRSPVSGWSEFFGALKKNSLEGRATGPPGQRRAKATGVEVFTVSSRQCSRTHRAALRASFLATLSSSTDTRGKETPGHGPSVFRLPFKANIQPVGFG